MRCLALLAVVLLIPIGDERVASVVAAGGLLDLTLEDSGHQVHVLRATFRVPTPLAVDYWTQDGPRLTIRQQASRSHQVPLVRLRAGRLYQYRVRETGTRGTFRTAPLPADLAAVRFAATGRLSQDLVLVHLFSEDAAGFRGYVAVDGDGEVVWHWRTKDYPFGAARRLNGNFVFMDKGRGIVEVTPGGDVVREIPQRDAENELHHDLVTTADDTVLFLAFDTESFQGATLKGESIWEWHPEAGTVERRWRSWEHFDPALDRGPRFGGEWMHANSLAIGPRGNILVSVHYFNQVLSLSPDWRTVEWRLGGVRATIPVPAGQEFSGQHTAREIERGRILLFDNGRDRGGFSRAVEFTLSEAVATKSWEWAPERANFASAVSSARRLENGHTLVAFGMSAGRSDSSGPTEAYEVTPGGGVAWHLVVSGTSTMFRVEPLSSIAGESRVP